MQNLQNQLIELLKDDTNYTSESKLLKNKLTEDALKLEPILLKYLLSNDRLKKHFFLDVDETLVFDKDKFIQFVNDKEFLPDSYTSFRNKIGLLDEDGKYFSEKRDVVLAWPYKDCVLEGGQDKEDQNRDEIFYNEVLAPDEIDRLFDPKVLTNFKRYDREGEHKNPQDLNRDDNLIIKGNNLLALHSLEKLYRGKVKLIYIDPPYNRNGDGFGYNDKFNHSSWLTFIKNRLEISKKLLIQDGSIWVNIDDNEAHYLKILLDQVFGRDNFKRNIIWQKKYAAANDAKGIPDMHDHIIVFSRSNSFKINLLPRTEKQDKLYKHDDGDGKGKWRTDNMLAKSFSEQYVFPITNPNTGKEYLPKKSKCWRASKETVDLWVNEDRIFFGKDGKGAPQLKRYLRKVQQGIVPVSWWPFEDAGHNDEAKKEIEKLDLILDDGSYFDTPKPEKLLKRIIEIGSDENDIILDFFAGSGTTGAVAQKLKRRYILLEQMDYVKPAIIKRLNKVITGEKGGISNSVDWRGGGSFVYAELKKWNQNYIDEIESTKTIKELLKVYGKMKDEAFFRYDVDLTSFDIEEFSELELEQQKEVLLECLDKNHLYVNLSEMDDTTYDISDEDKAMNKKFYGLD
ncbi:MAG: site-specific DNA-methyltransferase [Candidatus Marinimicrobia bacterium]|nr:site-specific DNA-methyltransferase [Candidatus Neomarinimicrobiota bacterium]